MKHKSWITFSGITWLTIGTFLLYKGLKLLSGSENATLFMAIGLAIGYLKGRYVLSKTVQRVSVRIASLSLPIRPGQVYAPSYWILIGSMMGLGLLFRFLPIPVDIKGFIDVAIGSALMNGAMLYFRSAKTTVVSHL